MSAKNWIWKCLRSARKSKDWRCISKVRTANGTSKRWRFQTTSSRHRRNYRVSLPRTLHFGTILAFCRKNTRITSRPAPTLMIHLRWCLWSRSRSQRRIKTSRALYLRKWMRSPLKKEATEYPRSTCQKCTPSRQIALTNWSSLTFNRPCRSAMTTRSWCLRATPQVWTNTVELLRPQTLSADCD